MSLWGCFLGKSRRLFMAVVVWGTLKVGKTNQSTKNPTGGFISSF